MARLNEREIGFRIRSLRKARNVSLGRLAKLTDLTKGYLSQIENSTKAPPFSTLSKVFRALGVDISYFFVSNEDEQRTGRITIVKPEERKKVDTGGLHHGYGFESLAHKKIGKNMEPYVVSVDSRSSGTFSHEGEQFLYILEGVLELNYGGERYVVKEGDSIYFDSGTEHSGRALGDGKVRMLCVIYNYRRV